MHEGHDPEPVLPTPRPTPRRSRQRHVDASKPPPAGLHSPSGPPSPPFLLATKIVPPRLQQGLIDRARLLHFLAEGSHRRLTVIKAPAGFGKTSLAIAWLSRLQGRGTRVAWLSMDEDDDEPARFLSHLAKSLQLACGPAVGLTVDASLARPRDVISILINELAQVEQDLYLFLDDYHLLSVAAIHDAMALLLSHAPPNLHVVIGTREDPPLPLARLRARNALLEIDASMLRFSFDETQQFLQRECECELPFPSVSTLHTATEGWAAALRLSASMLTPSRLKAGLGAQTPSGTSRPIAAYLEDMLASQPPELVDFMLRTAILDRLSAPLCQAVTGAADSSESQRLLDTLATRHLLLDPLDLDGHWFRYHQLLRDYLLQRLARLPGIDVAALHRRACHWYAAQALWSDAVRHALAAGDAAEALAMIARCAMTLVRQGDLLTLLGWQRHLPADILRGQSEVRLALARGMALAMRFDEALAMVQALEHDAAANAVPDKDHCLWACQAIRALMLGLRDDPPGALRLAQECLDRPVSPDTWTLNALTNVVRFAHWKSGQLDRLYDTPWIPYSVEEDQRNLLTSVYRLCLLGMAELQQMHFALAERHLSRSMQLAELHAGPQSTAAALCAPLLAQLRYEQDDLDGAEALLVDRMPLISAAVLLDSVLVAYALLIRIRAARGDMDQAHDWVDQAQSLGRQRGWHRLVAATHFERLRLLLGEGRTKEAAACGAELDRLARADAASGHASALEIDRYRTLGAAGLAMAEHRAADAIPPLDALLARFPQGRPDYLALRARTMLALTCLAAGERRRAVEECGHVLATIESAGAFRTILDHGPGVSVLLRAVREDTPATAQNKQRLATLDQLLERCHARYPHAGPREKEQAAAAGEREALSARERGILELIAAGQSNKEIARTLGIAPETVKSHVKSIFAKLSVEKRAQAVARAQSLGLVAGG